MSILKKALSRFCVLHRLGAEVSRPVFEEPLTSGVVVDIVGCTVWAGVGTESSLGPSVIGKSVVVVGNGEELGKTLSCGSDTRLVGGSVKGRPVNVMRVELAGRVVAAGDSMLSVGKTVSFTGSIDMVGAQVVEDTSSVGVSVGEAVLGVSEG